MNTNIKCNTSIDAISYICNRMFGLLKIPILFLNHEGTLLFEFPYESRKNPLIPNQINMHHQIIKSIVTPDRLVLKSTEFFENFAYLRVFIEDSMIGTIVLGPSLSSQIDEKSVDEFIRSQNIQAKYRKDLLKYYQRMIVIEHEQLVDAGALLYYSIYQEQLDRKAFVVVENIDVNTEHKKENDFDSFLSQKRKDSSFHHSLKFETELLNCIREGSKEKLLQFMENSTDGNLGMHSNNPLRNQKNLFISFSSLVSHAAIEGGLDWELALSLSDFYIQTVEEKHTIEDISNLFLKMFFDFADRVRISKAGNHSKSIIKCKNYIFEHLFDKISLSRIAENVGMNSSYISHLFKKEVGITIGEYIQRERIEEAKKQIVASDKNLAEIYSPLGFTDQGHFTKVFKKIAGITPSEYRTINK